MKAKKNTAAIKKAPAKKLISAPKAKTEEKEIQFSESKDIPPPKHMKMQTAEGWKRERMQQKRK